MGARAKQKVVIETQRRIVNSKTLTRGLEEVGLGVLRIFAAERMPDEEEMPPARRIGPRKKQKRLASKA